MTDSTETHTTHIYEACACGDKSCDRAICVLCEHVDVPPFDDAVPEYLVLRDGAFMQMIQDDGSDTFNVGYDNAWRDALSTAARRWGSSPEDAMASDEDLARYEEHNRAWRFMLDMVEDVESALNWHREKTGNT